MVEYKVFVFKESAFSSLVFGSAIVNEKKLEKALNELANQGWVVKSMQREQHRTGLFFSREAFLFILERKI
ncbi:MAG: DUF4177 domain-containing protein [bacterium]|nr:DUF4177 domain-containing protein [bacterium]